MLRAMLPVLWVMLLTFSACTDKAQELFQTAQFEEKQNNQEHARQLYEEIVKDYPNSETARKAADRLAQFKKDP